MLIPCFRHMKACQRAASASVLQVPCPTFCAATGLVGVSPPPQQGCPSQLTPASLWANPDRCALTSQNSPLPPFSVLGLPPGSPINRLCSSCTHDPLIPRDHPCCLLDTPGFLPSHGPLPLPRQRFRDDIALCRTCLNSGSNLPSSCLGLLTSSRGS